MEKTVSIADLGNILFDWFSVWCHSSNAMLNKVVEISGLSKDEPIVQIKPIHQKHGTAEYSFILESIPLLQERCSDKNSIGLIMDDATHAFRSEREKYLSLYPVVMDTLSILRSKGCYIVAYAKSRAYYSDFRLTRLGLDGVIDVLFSPEGHEISNGKKRQDKYNLMLTRQEYTPTNEIKPNLQLLLDITRPISATPEEYVYIGDSEMKDIEMAQKAGVSDAFASYGTNHLEENKEGYELFCAITHRTDTDVERERKAKENALGAKPTYVAKQFSNILSFFGFTKFRGKQNERSRTRETW